MTTWAMMAMRKMLVAMMTMRKKAVAMLTTWAMRGATVSLSPLTMRFKDETSGWANVSIFLKFSVVANGLSFWERDSSYAKGGREYVALSKIASMTALKKAKMNLSVGKNDPSTQPLARFPAVP